MCPIVVPNFIKNKMSEYRNVFCKDSGFEHILNYITGLILSPNKTLQGIYNSIISFDKKSSRRAMHESIFESPSWDDKELMKQHRKVISKDHNKKGKKRSYSY